MPLRDHFRPPANAVLAWDALHGMWPAMIVRALYDILPPGYVAAPKVFLGSGHEIDIAALEIDSAVYSPNQSHSNGTAPWSPPSPTLTLEADLAEQDEYEVRIYDDRYERRLVAAIELVSPGNKDRDQNRKEFVGKVVGLLNKGVCVSIVDVVSIRQFNFYADLLELIGHSDPALGDDPPFLYAVTLRNRRQKRRRPYVDTWFYPLAIGQPLPQLPIWLDTDLSISLELESSYEETCRLLHIV